MNSNKKIYEELLSEYPELKDSQMDIEEIINQLQKINPEIVPDETFKNGLKKRLDSISKYNPEKKGGIFSYVKFILPVFSFGFAIFGFMYLGNTSDNQISEPSFQQKSLKSEIGMMKMQRGKIADMQKEQIGENNNQISQDVMPKNHINNLDNEEGPGIHSYGGENEDINIASSSMMMSESSVNNTDSGLGVSDDNINNDDAHSEIIMGDKNIQTMNSEDDIFAEICGEYFGEIFTDEEENRYCEYEENICYEKDFNDNQCMSFE